MRELELEIRNPSGLHARPAALFVRTAAGFRSRITIARDGGPGADAKSILGLLSIGASRGATVRITIDGEDEAAAAESLQALVESGIGEEIG